MSVLGYWTYRGFAQHIRYMLHYVGEPFTEQLYEQGAGPEFSRDSWLKDKFTLGYDFPNLPFYDDGVVKMTQSMAITRYLARKHKLDGTTVQEKARIDQVVEEITDLREAFATLAYSSPAQFEADRQVVVNSVKDKFEQLERYLGNNTWFAGSNITYVDFLMYEMFGQLCVFEATLRDGTPKLNALAARVEALPAIQKYRESEKFISGPTFGPDASYF